MTVNGKCALCTKDAELKLSHMIPKFVFSWLKESGGAIRVAHVPNQRVQDGEKQYLLCSDCEGLFSKWEKNFYKRLFLPLHSNPTLTTPINYGPWALKFAVSVSWRILMYYHQLDDLHHLSKKQMENARTALNIWRGFLLGELPNPGQFEQHLLPVDVIKGYSGSEISPFLNRYLLRSVHMSVICSNTSAIVYTKMGHLILFGFIQEDTSKRWKGTKLHVNKGLIMPRVYHLPKYVAKYLNEQANKAAKALASVSTRQNQIIQESILENADEFVNCEIFRAMQYDVYHSGKNAFKITESAEDNETQE
jgi:hypothetical protein